MNNSHILKTIASLSASPLSTGVHHIILSELVLFPGLLTPRVVCNVSEQTKREEKQGRPGIIYHIPWSLPSYSKVGLSSQHVINDTRSSLLSSCFVCSHYITQNRHGKEAIARDHITANSSWTISQQINLMPGIISQQIVHGPYHSK